MSGVKATLKIFPQRVILQNKTPGWFAVPNSSDEIKWCCANFGADAMPTLAFPDPIDATRRWTWVPVGKRGKVVFFFKTDADAVAFKLAVS